jgi:hypothetical protein
MRVVRESRRLGGNFFLCLSDRIVGVQEPARTYPREMTSRTPNIGALTRFMDTQNTKKKNVKKLSPAQARRCPQHDVRLMRCDRMGAHRSTYQVILGTRSSPKSSLMYDVKFIRRQKTMDTTESTAQPFEGTQPSRSCSSQRAVTWISKPRKHRHTLSHTHTITLSDTSPQRQCGKQHRFWTSPTNN